MKIIVGFFLLVVASVSFASSTPYCRIGSDPVDTSRELSHHERVVLLEQDTMVRMGSGSGKVVTCMLRKGEPVVVNNRSGKAVWVYRCGNPIVAIAIDPVSAPAQKVAQRIIGVHYTPPPQQDPGINSAFNDCPMGSSCAASLRAFSGGVIGGTGLYAMQLRRGGQYVQRNPSNTPLSGHGGSTGGPVGGGGTGGGGGPVGGGGIQ